MTSRYDSPAARPAAPAAIAIATIAALLALAAAPVAVAHKSHSHDDPAVPTLAAIDRLIEANEIDEAIVACERYVERNPSHGGAWMRLASLRYQSRAFETAIPAYSHAYALGVHPEVAAYNAACCHSLLGDREESIEWLELALAAGFDDFQLLATDSDLDAVRGEAGYSALMGPPLPAEITRDDGFRFDIDRLLSELASRHYDVEHETSFEELTADAEDLKKRVPELADHEVIVEMMRIVTRVGDGHTRLSPPGTRSRDGAPTSGVELADFRRVPLDLTLFHEGWYVEAAAPEHAALVGKKLARVGSLSIEDAYQAVARVCPNDNPMSVIPRAGGYLRCPEILHALGVTDSPDEVVYQLEDTDGFRETARLAPVPWEDASPEQESWVRINDEAGAPLPLWQRNPDRNFWFEMLPESGTLYVNFSSVRDMDDETVEQFAERLFARLSEGDVERVVLDLRRNGGGNNFLNRPLVHALVKSESIDQPGRLFTIVGRRTFSAAMCLSVDLERHTETLFVGEPTGSSPNFIGETSVSWLPWSGMRLSVSTLFWQNSYSKDRRIWIPADIPAEMTVAAFRENRDPAMEAILAYEHPVAP